MTKREKNILTLASVVAALFVVTQGLPALQSFYAQRGATIEVLQTDLERQRRLIADEQEWSERRATAQARGDDLGGQLFQDSAIPLISANIQRLVREYATQAGVNITSTKLAESMAAEPWLLVEQELSILTDNQNNILDLLSKLENSNPLLGVSTFSLRRNRNQYAGTITVVGFSRNAKQ